MNIKLTLEYRGTNFFGWQKQPEVVTLEKNLEDAISVYFKSLLKKQNISQDSWSPKLYASGRTDAGVHSRGQIVSFQWPDEINLNIENFLKSINSLTHDDISVLDCKEVSDNFHARKSATNKTYTYKILLRHAPPTLEIGLVWHIRKLENIDEMISSAALFCGVHDFKSFCATDSNAKSTRRTIHSSYFFSKDKCELGYTITSSGFLKNQVRFIVGALVALGENRITVDQIKAMLDGGTRVNFKIAPPGGLYLESVSYK